jgi:hypothetical protein
VEQETIKGFPIISVYTPTRDCGVVARIVLVDRGVDGGLGRFVVAWQDTCDTPAGGWQPRWWQPHWRQPRYCPTLAEARNEFMKRAAVADGTAARIPQEGGRMTMEEEYFAVLGLGTMTAEKHYCTGCGTPATERCVECGEWRCGVHLHIIGKWCASTAGDRKRGEWCARGRHGVVGLALTCDANMQRDQGVLCDSGAPRLVRFCYKGTNDHYERKAHWRCAAHLEDSADDGWRWREETQVGAESECEASVCSMGTHRGRVRTLWLRREFDLSWEGPKRCCEQALELYRGLYPNLEWSSYKPESPRKSVSGCSALAPLTAAQLEEMCREAAGYYENDLKRVSSPLHDLPCEASAASGKHEGPVVRGRWKSTISPDWSRVLAYCEGCRSFYAVTVPGFEWASKSDGRISDASKPLRNPLVPRSDAKLPDPSKFPAKSGTPHQTGHNNVRLGPEPIIYCSSAPPRELVESAIVRCGTGLEGGEPVMGPLVWSWPRRREWDRHVAFAPDGLGTYEGEGRIRWARGTTIADHDETIDLGGDAFGGRSLGVRCRLCGGWIRTKQEG